MSALKIEDLEVRYGLSVAASGISMHVNRGEIVALLGPNGAGKTSVLRAVMGQVAISNGSVTYNQGGVDLNIGGRPTHELARLGISIVFAQQVVLPKFTVHENILVGGRYLGVRDTDLAKRIDDLYARFPDLAVARSRPAAQLSGGVQRQLAICRALVARPQLILLDEPSIGLSPAMLNVVFEMIQQISRGDGASVLFVEQNIKKALETADRAYVMRVGAMDFSGPSVDVLKNPALQSAYLGD